MADDAIAKSREDNSRPINPAYESAFKKIIENPYVDLIVGLEIVQLTTDKSRQNAYKFYEQLGFKASHEGFKLYL